MLRSERLKELEKLSVKWRKADNGKHKWRNLYIKNFDEIVTDEELWEIFLKFCEVESLKIMRDENGKLFFSQVERNDRLPIFSYSNVVMN